MSPDDNTRSLGAYDFCIRFFVELASLGVTDVVVSPGSRSTALVLAAEAAGADITIHHDERVAAFHALGAAKQNRRPVALVCTSGTASANYHPAVIEAHHANVPLIVCTADRPPELREWGAGQTIDQTHLFGRSVRWFHEIAVAGEVPADSATALALRAYTAAADGRGPVHLNWPFREPLEPSGPLHRPLARLSATPRPVSAASPRLAELAGATARGLIVVGPNDIGDRSAAQLMRCAQACGWPVLADPGSGLRSGPSADSSLLVTTCELLLGVDEFTAELGRAEVIFRVGPSPTSKAYRLWLEREGCDQLVLVDPGSEWGDPTGSVTEVVPGPLEGLFDFDIELTARETGWLTYWADGERRARAAADDFLKRDPGELGAVSTLIEYVGEVGSQASVVVSNSMPIRELDLAMRPSQTPLRVLANRGASGIDGVLATAGGAATNSSERVWVLLGDVATLHDLGGLAAIPRLGLTNVTAVVVDNDGGGIFSMLPVADAISPETFSRLFTTPHRTDIGSVARALGWSVHDVDSTETLAQALEASAAAGPSLVWIKTDIDSMTSGLSALRSAVGDALAR